METANSDGGIDTLLISTNFFGYPQEIVKALAARGRAALWFDDRPAADTLTKAMVRISPKLIQRKSDEYFERVFSEAAKYDIRDILVIKGEALSLDAIRRMREKFPKARLTLYFWDSYRNMPAGSAEKVDLFDRTFSFDLEDVKADRRLIYRPLFFVEDYADTSGVTQDIDLLFIGTAHSDRVRVLERIARAVPPGYEFRKILYVRSKLLHRLQLLIDAAYRRVPRGDFIFQPIPKREVQALVARARVIVDIERAVQTGFTMRTIEMVGASRKLLTTNSKVLEADFYRPENQAFADRDAPVIDRDFLEADWLPLPEAMLKRYSLSGWLDDVLG